MVLIFMALQILISLKNSYFLSWHLSGNPVSTTARDVTKARGVKAKASKPRPQTKDQGRECEIFG